MKHTDRCQSALLSIPLEFDLSYLILLTESGTKPLSRWEGAVPGGIEEVMQELGLHFAYVRRGLYDGNSTTEFIFSKSDAHLDLYIQHFDGSLIDKSPAVQRIEGFLFGFPPCCIESFALSGYVPNGLDNADQQLLFHWACPGCRMTPLMLPAYRSVHHRCSAILAGRGKSHGFIGRRRSEVVRKVVVAASVLGLVTAGATLSSRSLAQRQSVMGDEPHWLPWPVGMDTDGDFLPDADEPYLGVQADNPDSDGDGVLDGVQLARAVHAIYTLLPHEVRSDAPYVIDHLVWGLETCTICGVTVNMGYVEIINPLENLTIETPYIALHYLEHGSFRYAGDVHGEGHIQIRKLKSVLDADGSLHRLLSDNGDDDRDGLYDPDEPFVGTDSSKADSDMDGVIDGTQLSRAFAAIVDSLPRVPKVNAPYAEDHLLRGIITCPRCGDILNMGYVRAINPLENQWIDLPYLALHYMHCGGVRYDTGTDQDVVDPRVLKTVLESDGTAHRLPVQSDDDGDGLADKVEPRFGCQAGKPDSDGDGVADGVQLARQMWTEIEGLPGEESSSPYRIEHMAKGLETCEMCGLEVNMGYVEIFNAAEGQSVELPYISLHYLQHGSFVARGSAHAFEQFDPRTLDCVLHSNGSMHLLPIADDADADGLTTAEETHFGTRPDLADSDNDGLLDGAEISRKLLVAVDSLPRTVQSERPYRLDMQANGLEECEVCGEVVNMGFVAVINPAQADSVVIPYIGLHAMHHAGFAYNGTVHDGRVDPLRLAALLEIGSTTSVDAGQGDFPAGSALLTCHPNPFNPATRIGYNVGVVGGQWSVAARVRLAVYDLLGREVAVLVDEQKEPGSYEVVFDGSGLASGIYICSMQSGDVVASRKLLLLR